MQVNRVQSSNYNTSFGRLGRYGSESCGAGAKVQNFVDSYRGSNNKSAKDLVDKLIDKCDRHELKQLAEQIEKKLKPANIDTTWL